MIDKKYVLYLLATVLSVLMLEVYASFSELSESMEEKMFQMQKTLSELKKEKREIIKLKEEVSRLGIKPLSREEALENILKKTDYFAQMYDATVTEPLSEENRMFLITVSFEYYPESSEDLIEFINKLHNQVSPQIIVKKFRLDNLQEGTKTYFEITLKQPFKGEG